MKHVTRVFKTLQEAERFQNSLYWRYNYVRLVDWPRFSEAGHYTWKVRVK